MAKSSRPTFGEVGLMNLPSEVIDEIFLNLDYRDLINCSYVNKRFNDLANHPKYWKTMCNKYWLETKCPSKFTWKENFTCWYRDMGEYIDCYVTVKTAWEKILTFMNTYCPAIYATVKGGASEQELDEAESIMGLNLPKDFRCSYRMHNGQTLSSPGLMGSMSIHSHYKSESLLDINTLSIGYRSREGVRGCIPLTFCLHSGITQYLAVNDEDGYNPNTVFYLSQSDLMERHHPDAFITGTSFQEWLMNYAEHLEKESFTLIQDQPFRFLHDPASEETTGYITVSVATCFIPELSKVFPPTFFHSYRITMYMSPDAPLSEGCQLETRHWIVTDETGAEKEVDGNGVVGQYPIMVPGATFSWISCTKFCTTYGSMKGHFKLRNLATGDRIEVKCPAFHMKCLPYITAEERAAYKSRIKKSN